MEYRFLDRTDEDLIAVSELPVEGIALAVRSTGYDVDEDEVVELAIATLGGDVVFHRIVKPQNVEGWAASEASGGLSEADVAGCCELYEFEDEIAGLADGAQTVVALHLPFVASILESSWVSLPDRGGVDLMALFLASHSTSDYPGKPAAAATLEGIAGYYGVPFDGSSLAGSARTVAACYRALVREHAERREAKGAGYWARRDERLAAEAAQDEAGRAASRISERRMNQMNALLWVAGAIIFISLAIQFQQRGMDVSLSVIAVAVAVFDLYRAVVNWRK